MEELTSRSKFERGCELLRVMPHRVHCPCRLMRRTDLSLELPKAHIVWCKSPHHLCRRLGHSRLGKRFESLANLGIRICACRATLDLVDEESLAQVILD